MRRAKIQVKPNIGKVSSSASVTAVKSESENVASVSAQSSAKNSPQPNATAEDSCQGDNTPVANTSSAASSTLVTLASAAERCSEELTSTADAAKLVEVSDGSIEDRVFVSSTTLSSSAPSLAPNTSVTDGVSSETTSNLTKGQCVEGVQSEGKVHSSSMATTVQTKSVSFDPVVLSAENSKQTSDLSQSLKVTQAKRWKTQWKPNLQKACTAAGSVTSSSPMNLRESGKEVESTAAIAQPVVASDATVVVPVESSIGDTVSSEKLEVESIHMHSEATEVTDSLQVAVSDGVPGKAAVIRRGKFAAKPNVAKAARVRLPSLSAPNAGTLPVELQNVQSVSQRQSSSASESVPIAASEVPGTTKAVEPDHGAVDSTQTEVLISKPTSLPMSAERVAAKLVERRIKLKRNRRQLEQLFGPIDRSIVCIRDLIYMNPVNNPMKSQSGPSQKPTLSVASLEECSNDSKVGSTVENDNDENSAPVPQVKVGPDGKIVLNMDSVVVEEKKMKEEKYEVIDETNIIRRGYPKKHRPRMWDAKETKKFYLLLSQIGTDFSLMCRLFTDRTRADLKKKFKREEKIHHELVEKALAQRRGLDITLLAEPSSSSEDESVASSKTGKKRKVKSSKDPETADQPRRKYCKKPKATTAPSSGVVVADKDSLAIDGGGGSGISTEGTAPGLEEHFVSPLPVAGPANGVVKKPKKKHKKTAAKYYESSSDSEEEETNVSLPPPPPPTSSAPTSQHQSTPIAAGSETDAASMAAADAAAAADNEDDDGDEVQIIRSICGRPTRSGRLPRPVVRTEELEYDDGDDVTPKAETKSSPIKAKSARGRKSLTNVSGAKTVPQSTTVPSAAAGIRSHAGQQLVIGQRTALPQSTSSSLAPAGIQMPLMLPLRSPSVASPLRSPLLASGGVRSPLSSPGGGGVVGIGRLPSGVFVVMESRQPVPPYQAGSSVDRGGSNQQMFYHIFAELPPGLSSPQANAAVQASSVPSATQQTVRFAQPVVFPRAVAVTQPVVHPQQTCFTAAAGVSSPAATAAVYGGSGVTVTGIRPRALPPSPVAGPSMLPSNCFAIPTAPQWNLSGGATAAVRTPQTAFLPINRLPVQAPRFVVGTCASTVSSSVRYPNVAIPVFQPPTFVRAPIQSQNLQQLGGSRFMAPATANVSLPFNSQFPAGPQPSLSSNLQSIDSVGSSGIVPSSGFSNWSTDHLLNAARLQAVGPLPSRIQSATQQADGTLVITADDVVGQPTGNGDTQVVQVIEHEDGTTELLIDGSFRGMTSSSADDGGGQLTADGGTTQYIDVVVEHYQD